MAPLLDPSLLMMECFLVVRRLRLFGEQLLVERSLTAGRPRSLSRRKDDIPLILLRLFPSSTPRPRRVLLLLLWLLDASLSAAEGFRIVRDFRFRCSWRMGGRAVGGKN